LFGLTNRLEQVVITDADGNFSFTGLPPDSYRVCETLQAGWTQTAPNTQTVAPTGERIVNCSDAPGVSGTGYGFLISEGTETFQGNDFGNQQIPLTGQLSGTKWNDLNGNGSQDPDEPGLPGWSIHIFRVSSAQELARAFTDGNGGYSFPNLPAGTYDVCESPTEGWTQTFPPAARAAGQNCQTRTGGIGYSVTVTAGETVSAVDFGNRLPTPAETGVKIGRKWNDLNGNGLPDAGEPGLSGWQLHLFRNSDPSFHQEVITDSNGNYAFIGLTPGVYTVCETTQPGWTQTAPNSMQPPPPPVGEREVDCAGRTGVNGIGYAFTITGDEVLEGNDFGNQEVVTATAVPTLSEWAMIALALLLIGVGYRRLRGQRAALP
jgi:SdrD B-like domain/IPTL-CTERM motif